MCLLWTMCECLPSRCINRKMILLKYGQRRDEQAGSVQTAPAVRVALGEEFGLEPGEITTGQMIASLKRLGFERVSILIYG